MRKLTTILSIIFLASGLILFLAGTSLVQASDSFQQPTVATLDTILLADNPKEIGNPVSFIILCRNSEAYL